MSEFELGDKVLNVNDYIEACNRICGEKPNIIFDSEFYKYKYECECYSTDYYGNEIDAKKEYYKNRLEEGDVVYIKAVYDGKNIREEKLVFMANNNGNKWPIWCDDNKIFKPKELLKKLKDELE